MHHPAPPRSRCFDRAASRRDGGGNKPEYVIGQKIIIIGFSRRYVDNAPKDFPQVRRGS
jgi:hypothetical protein